MQRPPRRSSPIWALGLLLLVFSCGDDDPTGPGPSITLEAGPFVLQRAWTYQEWDSTSAGWTQEADVAWRVSRRMTLGGSSYAEVAGGGDTLYLAIAGSGVYQYPPLEPISSSPGEPEYAFETFLARRYMQSAPWKIGDTAAAPGTEWNLFSADTTIRYEGISDLVRVSARAVCLGRTSVTVPAGTFANVCRFRTIWSIYDDAPGWHYEEVETIDYYYEPSLGFVKTEWRQAADDTDEGPSWSARRSLLRTVTAATGDEGFVG